MHAKAGVFGRCLNITVIMWEGRETLGDHGNDAENKPLLLGLQVEIWAYLRWQYSSGWRHIYSTGSL
jgi:hypothetical protein